MDGSPIRNQQLSYIDMFGYIRRDSETRPSGYSSVTLPTNPAPSYDSGVGYTNSTLHFGDHDGFDSKKDGTNLRTSSDQCEEEERVDRIRRLVNQVTDLRSIR